VRAPPMCKKPVGEGAKRVITGSAIYHGRFALAAAPRPCSIARGIF
jgi:hypothetical protein